MEETLTIYQDKIDFHFSRFPLMPIWPTREFILWITQITERIGHIKQILTESVSEDGKRWFQTFYSNRMNVIWTRVTEVMQFGSVMRIGDLDTLNSCRIVLGLAVGFESIIPFKSAYSSNIPFENSFTNFIKTAPRETHYLIPIRIDIEHRQIGQRIAIEINQLVSELTRRVIQEFSEIFLC
jgi:hypothetical protein